VNQLELVDCPFYADSKDVRCGLPSEIVAQQTAQSTHGPVEIIAIRCVVGHFYTGPTDLMWA
jgi:hypothetical protein